jgi:hypothetical protein
LSSFTCTLASTRLKTLDSPMYLGMRFLRNKL